MSATNLPNVSWASKSVPAGARQVAVLQGPKAVLGPGTGLGEAQLFWDEIQGGYKVWPSEGSHSGFAPRGWKQRALQASKPPYDSPSYAL